MAAPLKDKNEIKIFILYLLDKIGYPLELSTVTSIVIQDGVVEFFDFNECFYELVEQGLVDVVQPRNPDGTKNPNANALYMASIKGRQVALGLSDSIMRGVRERSYRSALRHLSFKQSGAVVDHSAERDGDAYIFKCSIRDIGGVVMDVKVRTDNEQQVERMSTNYPQHPEVIYRGLIALLTGDVNYIFEE